MISNNVAFWQVCAWLRQAVQPPLSLESRSVAKQSYNIQATSKDSGQITRMHCWKSHVAAHVFNLIAYWDAPFVQIISEWSGNTTITNCRPTHGTARKSHTTITRHQEDKLSKATSSLFPSKMNAKLEWTHSFVQQYIEQLQTPTMGLTINNKSTTKEPPP